MNTIAAERRNPITVAEELELQLALGKTRAEAAREVGLSTGHAYRYRALLKLTPDLQDLVRCGDLSVTGAAALVGLDVTITSRARQSDSPRPTPGVTIVGRPGVSDSFKIVRNDLPSRAGTLDKSSPDVLHVVETDNPLWLATELRRRCLRWAADGEWLTPPPRTLRDLRSLRRWNQNEQPEFVA